MELDDMKQMWQQQDQAMQRNTALNEKVLEELLKHRSGGAINRMLNLEYLGGIVAGLFLLFVVINNEAIGSSTWLSICYWFNLIFVGISIGLTVYKIRLLHSINLVSSTVTDTAEKMQRFQLFITYERGGMLVIAPFFLAAVFAILIQFVHGVDIFENIKAALPRLIAGTIGAIFGMLILYRRLYFANIHKVTSSLKEIEAFRKE